MTDPHKQADGAELTGGSRLATGAGYTHAVTEALGAGQTHAVTEALGATPSATTGTFSSGHILARRFRIDAYLAEGGMGQVYRAHDLELDAPLALKTIHPGIASNAAFLRLFKQEVLLARSISHPNVCRIFDFWRDEATGVSFLTMEFLAGETLAARIKAKGAFSTEDTLPLARQMAEALDAAHRAGIVHRDFKSPNVMVVPNGNGGRAVITDFGLAVTVEAGEKTRPAPERDGSGKRVPTQREILTPSGTRHSQRTQRLPPRHPMGHGRRPMNPTRRSQPINSTRLWQRTPSTQPMTPKASRPWKRMHHHRTPAPSSARPPTCHPSK
ncbi:MAG: serine/threonine-protein kinase [Candidatus Eisenbacteria bacterium]